MDQFYDYRMVDDRPVVEQAHELQALTKELDNFKCNLLDKFVAGGIIAELLPSWELCYFSEIQEIGVHCSWSYRHS
jgi:hypothetical protein